MTAERRQFTEEFKREAVRLAQERGNLAQTARELGLSDSVSPRWEQALADSPERPFPGQGNPRDAEVAQLQRGNARLREEVEILKSAAGIFLHCPQ